MKLANCRCCGGESALNRHDSSFFIGCRTEFCVVGPLRLTKNAAIEAWNDLMQGSPSIPEGAVGVRIPVHYRAWDGNHGIAWSGYYDIGEGKTRDVSQETPFAIITAHIVPPRVQEVEGTVE